MESPSDATGESSKAVSLRAALVFLFVGNIVIGSGVLAPAAMINSMTANLGVSSVAIGALIGWGAVVLCIGAPAFGFLTNRVGRRALLAGSLALYAVGHIASAFAPNYEMLLWVRLAMISGAAIFTPQAASAVALMVPESRRASSVALVFMGWALAGAAVVPLMSILAETVSWRSIYMALGLAAAVAAAAIMWVVPGKLFPARMSLQTWASVLSNPPILLLLTTTTLQITGQFTLYPYLAAELRAVTQADAGGVSLALGLYGGAGLFGSLVAARVVNSIGAPRTQIICLIVMAVGLAGWSVFAASYTPAALSILIWGLGFGAGVAMQQARLISVAPPLASASVALNTSFLYLGQAAGSAIGGELITRQAPNLLGPVGLAFMLCAIAASFLAARRFSA